MRYIVCFIVTIVTSILIVCGQTNAGNPVFYAPIQQQQRVQQVVQPQQVITQQRVVQFDPNTYLGLEGYYNHGENLVKMKEEITSETIDQLKEQNKLLTSILNALNSKNSMPMAPVNPNIPVVPPTVVPPISPSLPPVPADTRSELEKSVTKIFSDNCIRCHGDAQSNGGLTLMRNGQLQDIGLASAILVHHRTNGVRLTIGEETRMPKGAPALDTDSVETIRLWLVELAKKSKGK